MSEAGFAGIRRDPLDILPMSTNGRGLETILISNTKAYLDPKKVYGKQGGEPYWSGPIGGDDAEDDDADYDDDNENEDGHEDEDDEWGKW